MTKVEKLRDRLKAEIRDNSLLRVQLKELEAAVERLLARAQAAEKLVADHKGEVEHMAFLRASEREGLMHGHQAEADSFRQRIAALQLERDALYALLIAVAGALPR